MKKDKWVWMPHAGHFICAYRCVFHLNTYVGGYIVSTVGEMMKLGLNDERAIDTIGYDRLYETMVFKAKKSKHTCCPYVIIVEKQVDFRGYNKPEDAYKGHMSICRKWAILNTKEAERGN